MRNALACLALTVLAIAGFWTWLGSPLPMQQFQLGRGEKLYCVSYTPFRGAQTPLDPATMIPAAQIEDDLVRLAQISDCVRTYSVDFGLDQIAGIAAKHGLKVMLGLWLSSNLEKSRYQVETAVAVANKYPGTVRSIVVGNEVLLRGDMTAIDLASTIRAVKARVHVPVTYADVWEFWLRNSDVANAVDFITIHILPYWEDFPVAARDSVAHVETIRRQVVNAFPGKEVLIGEVGWPSAGRMREAALPSSVNQARVVQDVLALSKRENFRVNIIEAFDQPWKRALEGTVGGHWGLLDATTRTPKFAGTLAVSNHPHWLWQGGGGILFAIIVFGAAMSVRTKDTSPLLWAAIGALPQVPQLFMDAVQRSQHRKSVTRTLIPRPTRERCAILSITPTASAPSRAACLISTAGRRSSTICRMRSDMSRSSVTAVRPRKPVSPHSSQPAAS
jgi:exo-beta-1,3-glucanase (GH17 family)